MHTYTHVKLNIINLVTSVLQTVKRIMLTMLINTVTKRYTVGYVFLCINIKDRLVILIGRMLEW